MESTDTELVAMIKRGAEDANKGMRILHDRYHSRVNKTCSKLLRERYDLMDEAANKTWRLVWLNIANLRNDERLSAWITRIAANVSVDVMRAEVRARRNRGSDPEEQEEIGQTTYHDKPAAPDEVAERKERQRALEEALDQLPKIQKEVMILRHIRDMTWEEISEALGISVATAKTHEIRARRALISILRQHSPWMAGRENGTKLGDDGACSAGLQMTPAELSNHLHRMVYTLGLENEVVRNAVVYVRRSQPELTEHAPLYDLARVLELYTTYPPNGGKGRITQEFGLTKGTDRLFKPVCDLVGASRDIWTALERAYEEFLTQPSSDRPRGDDR